MSSLKHPVGPQSSRVYWRRRLVVGLALLAIVVVILLIVFAPRGNSDASAPVATHTSVPTKTPTHASAPVGTATPVTTQTATAKPLPTTKTTAAAKTCKNSDVDVEAITDNDNYAAAQQPKLSFSITNTGTAACTFDVGTAKQVFTITSGTEVYWKSTDCQVKPASTVILLEPGKTLASAPITWDRTRSDPSTCNAKTRPAVPAGGASYHLQVTVNGVVSSGTKQFLLY
ncbi:hypothetical protein [Humibacter ginsenosidimutans]|uniref:DUF4232 domain-containing protein n=1 Tax=Humibacter ginsenosidimutans TaxID=2599293 RepID=A0A5B8M581_9MICO|nr:hypothetical protein [Humibacter ginsenosidimutans]QDZ15114.1 hypothetical protein FPZ11_10320 [Humibacter ginsenosidimutans]